VRIELSSGWEEACDDEEIVAAIRSEMG
jgi:hypothetical protein